MPAPSHAKREPVAAASASTALSRWLLRGVDRLSSRIGPTPDIAAHLRTGLRGEEDALFYLRDLGYVVVARRWRTPKLQGDVDLIAWDGETLCFIEVKTRVGRDIVPAEFAVDASKQKQLRSMAGIFRKRFPAPKRSRIPIRFDVLAVYLPPANSGNQKTEIEIFPAAF